MTIEPRAVAKVELHRHLEGAIRLSTVVELSHQAGVPLPAETPEELAGYALLREPVHSLEAALQKFVIAHNSVRTYDAVRRIAREAIEDLAAENVRLAELRFSPQFLCEPGRLDWDGALDAVAEGVDQAVGAGNDVAVGLVAIFSRDYGPESGRRTVEFALRHREQLVGFDIAGSEVGFPPRAYSDLIPRLRDAGLGVTAHYGESGPPEFVREAVVALQPDRIGHGLAVARDGSVLDLVIERGVTLEMCPTSNFLTGGVPSVAEHPIRRLLNEGVRVTLNTDDPALMGIDLNHEWESAQEEIGFTDDDFRKVSETALAASFMPAQVVADVRARRFGWLDERSELV